MAAACGGSGSSTPPKDAAASPAVQQVPALQSEQQIAALLYDNSYKAPDGFYVDARADTERSYTLHHVLDDTASYELCSDDFAEAMAWEEADNAERSVQGYFVEAFETSRYFEIARELSYENDVGNVEDISSPGFARVFKCRDTSRDGVDRSELNGYAGRINALPVSAERIRVFSEYLWQFTFFPNSRKKVLASYPSATGDHITHTLRLAFATNQGTGQCDLIEVADWRYSVHRVSGEVRRQFDVIRRFEAQNQAGVVSVCN
jgi:hypothetical protein